MTDDPDLARLKRALDEAAPAPDPARRAARLAAARAAFAAAHPAAGAASTGSVAQGPAAAARPIAARPRGAGLPEGLRAMFDRLTSPAALAAATGAAALGLVAVIVTTDAPPPRGLAGLPAAVPPAPEAAALAEAGAPPAALEAAPGRDDAAEAPPAAAPAAARDARARSDSGADPGAGAAGVVAAAPDAVALPAPPAAAAPWPGEAGAAAVAAPDPGTEAFASADPNPVRVTAESPVSTFSIDVDTASYAVVRSSLEAGSPPPPEAVRIEEMVNYFPYDWPAPEADGPPFRPTVSVMPTPWNPGTRLVTIALQGRLPAADERPPLNLVFLIDTSGSMDAPNRRPLLRQALRLMLPELRPGDEVAIVAYAGSAGEVLPPTPAADRAAIEAALDRLEAGGSTAGGEGLRLAYRTAARMAAEGEVSRVILATDGDFNVGISDPAELARLVARERRAGTYLTVLGFGRGNLDDATMQALAQAGNGTAAYIDTLSEARKVLVEELSGALFPIADDVKIQVEWNPATVAEWRLIGYETRALAREDFADDRVDAGEIGAGHRVTALYEITPVGSPARRTEDLRYQAPPEAAGPADELGFLRLRWKEPGGSVSALLEQPIPVDAPEGGTEARWAAAIAGFGQLLTGGRYLGDWGWDEAIALAESARGADPFGYRAEAIGLMRLAKALTR